jgi:hypothetical protein
MIKVGVKVKCDKYLGMKVVNRVHITVGLSPRREHSSQIGLACLPLVTGGGELAKDQFFFNLTIRSHIFKLRSSQKSS